MAKMLYSVSAFDPVTFSAAALGLASIAIVHAMFRLGEAWVWTR
jgi:hypothetical protein